MKRAQSKPFFSALRLVGLAAACFLLGSGVAAALNDPVARWQRNLLADGTPRPIRETHDTTVWPNFRSHANSDPWLAANHDRIREMHPRLLVINFSNQVAPDKPLKLAKALITAIRESSRYHGYKDPAAKPFLLYHVWRYVDLRDSGVTKGNCSASPIKPGVPAPEMNCDYNGFFGEKLAARIGVRDPRNPSRFLRLDELINQGFVHEVWFTAAPSGDFRCLECVEMKPVYDEQFHQVPGKFVQAGNGGDDGQQWTGRSVRINGLNHDRGIGCAMENLAHSFEGMSHSGAIPYFSRYFPEFAMFDLDKRYGLPFDSYYALWGPGKGIEYPNPHTAVVTDGVSTWTLQNYVATAGNVHFMPNGRHHYDLHSMEPVMSTIEDWRIGSGPGGQDLAKPWTCRILDRYADVAPDCMGKWLVYWRQNVPGYRNLSRDDRGRPMKNWWPFLFY